MSKITKIKDEKICLYEIIFKLKNTMKKLEGNVKATSTKMDAFEKRLGALEEGCVASASGGSAGGRNARVEPWNEPGSAAKGRRV